jgi:GT2 family glycosyltransferase
MRMQLSVIIVNYKSADLILDALESLYSETASLLMEVFVVDNASGDDSLQRITQAYPKVTWIDMGYNAGFARANNAGIRASSGAVVLLLNPDTLVLDNAVARAYTALAASSYVACGVQLVNPDGSPQISGNYFMKGGLNHLLPLPYWGDLLRWTGYRAGTKVPNVLESSSVQEVDWISGAFLMVKRSAIEQAGLMDEDFFLYGEEVEWCSRLHKVGKLCLFGDYKIVHLQGETVVPEHGSSSKGYRGLFSKKDYQLMVSNHLRVRKQFGVGWFLFLLLNYSFGVLVYFIASFFHRLFTLRNPFGEWGQASRFALNVARLWAISPRIMGWNPYFYKVM